MCTMKTLFYFTVGCTGAGCLEHLCYEEACRDKHSRLSLFWEGQKKLKEFALDSTPYKEYVKGPSKACFPAMFCLSLLEYLLCIPQCQVLTQPGTLSALYLYLSQEPCNVRIMCEGMEAEADMA